MPSHKFIESETIAPVPEDHRHGQARDLFFVWFGANMILLGVITGGLTTTVFGLPLGWAIIAVVIGDLIGAIFMALHAAQGPQLGVPQMIQSRGQFGSHGAVLIIVIVVGMYTVFFATSLIASAQALARVVALPAMWLVIIVMAVTNLIVTAIGYRMVHVVMKIGTVVLGGLFAVALITIAINGHLTSANLAKGHFNIVGFSSVIAINALWVLAYAPYVSDYSRYMPKDTGVRAAFWGTYSGCVLGTLVPMSLGAAIGTAVTGDDILGGVVTMLGPMGAALLVVGAIHSGIANSINLYGGALCTITIGQTFFPSWIPKAKGRLAVAGALTFTATAVAVAGAQSFLPFVTNVLALLLFVLTPWTAVNLVDYYLVRHGDYDIKSFFERDGGVYGRWNRPALVSFVIGLAVQVPFLVTTLYTGPVASALHGIDISWLVGLFVTCPLYYIVAHRAQRPELPRPISSQSL